MTLQEISDLCGVSPATVSRVINHSAFVSKDTYDKVMDAVEKSGYLKNSEKAMSKTKKIIGVIVPDLLNPFFNNVIASITSEAESNSLEVIVMGSYNDSGKEKRAISLMKNLGVCGLVITPTTDCGAEGIEVENLLKGLNIPIVLVDRDVKNTSLDGVFLNNTQSSFEAMCYLIEKGHRDIAVIAGPQHSKPGRDRLKGYYNAFEKYDIPVKNELVFEGDFTLESGYRITRQILRLKNRPTAIFSCNNQMSIGCIKALEENKIIIGQEIELVGFDELDILDILHIPMATIQRPTVEMGKVAIEILMQRIRSNGKDESTGRRVVLLPKLDFHK